MGVNENLSNHGRPLEMADMNGWPKVDPNTVKKKHQKRFIEIRDAIRIYCGGVKSFRAVSALTGVL